MYTAVRKQTSKCKFRWKNKLISFCVLMITACNQEEVNKAIEDAHVAQKAWAKTPLWKRAEALHRFAGILKDQKAAIAEALVKEIAKPHKDALTEVNFSSLLYFASLSYVKKFQSNMLILGFLTV